MASIGSGSATAGAGGAAQNFMEGEDVGDDDEEIEFREMGTGGASVEGIMRAAIAHLTNFLVKLGHHAADSYSKIVPTESLVKRFATYLAETATAKFSTKLISCGSALNYLSQVKKMWCKRAPDLEMWKTAENGCVHKKLMNSYYVVLLSSHYRLHCVFENCRGWYTNLRYALTIAVTKRQMKAGEPVASKSREIGRKILLELCERLHGIANDTRSTPAVARKAMKDILLITLTFLAVGRSGEVGLSSWKASFWCHEAQCLVLQWPELKTGEGKRAPTTKIQMFIRNGFILIL
jgi:hypothetical protein